MSFQDYVKYLTVTIVSEMEVPKEERKQRRAERKMVKSPFLVRCFGLLPLSAAMLYRKIKK